MAMASSLQLPTSDLRRHGIEAKRVHTHKAKWARGARQPPYHGPGSLGARSIKEQPPHLRPAQPMFSQVGRAVDRREREVSIKSLSRATKINFHADLRDELFHPSDSSADEEAELDDTAASTPMGDAGVYFSFDANRAPGQGSEVLAQAVTRAVTAFEDKETQRVVGEYEIVEVEEEGKGSEGEWEDEEGFEIVGRDEF